MNMIEKVARAFEPEFFNKYDKEAAKGRKAANGKPWVDVCYGKYKEYALIKAKAAIFAMREPSERMKARREEYVKIYYAFIDAALKEE